LLLCLNLVTDSKQLEAWDDYVGRWIWKKVSVCNTGSWVLETTKTFVYDDWNLIRETTTDGGTSTDYYVWGLDLSSTLQGAGGIGGLLAKTNSLTSETFLYTFDANGNVGQLLDSSTGTIAAHYEYDPFGNLLVSTGSEAESNVFRFSTKYYDAEVDLYYYGYRYYSPTLGRWMTRDPIGERGGLNLYGFVGNNPINRVDPDGRLSPPIPIIIVPAKCSLDTCTELAIQHLFFNTGRPTMLTGGMVKGLFAAEAEIHTIWQSLGELFSLVKTYGPGQLGKSAMDDVCQAFGAEMQALTEVLRDKCEPCLGNPCNGKQIGTEWKDIAESTYFAGAFTAGYLHIKIENAANRAGRSRIDAVKFGLGIYHGAFDMLVAAQQKAGDTVHWAPVQEVLQSGEPLIGKKGTYSSQIQEALLQYIFKVLIYWKWSVPPEA
jgi:RHS repeat-associated protein